MNWPWVIVGCIHPFTDSLFSSRPLFPLLGILLEATTRRDKDVAAITSTTWSQTLLHVNQLDRVYLKFHSTSHLFLCLQFLPLHFHLLAFSPGAIHLYKFSLFIQFLMTKENNFYHSVPLYTSGSYGSGQCFLSILWSVAVYMRVGLLEDGNRHIQLFIHRV